MKAKLGHSIHEALVNFGSRFRRVDAGDDTGPGPSPDDQFRAAQREFYERFVGREVEMNDHRGDHRRRLRGDPHVPVEPGRLHDVFAGQEFVPPERKILSYILAKTETGLARPDGRGRAHLPRRPA